MTAPNTDATDAVVAPERHVRVGSYLFGLDRVRRAEPLGPSLRRDQFGSGTRGELHGYGIARDVEELSDGRVRLAAGTLYGALNRLTEAGLIAQTGEQEVGGRRRRYYSLTSIGEAALAEEAARLRSTAAALSSRGWDRRRSRPEAGMTRRLLETCLLAYPRACRERDRDYLRDLSLDLADTHGLARQAMSSLVGGLKERIEVRRRRAGTSTAGWARRTAIACVALLGSTAAAIGLVGISRGDVGSVHELEEYVCVYAEDAPARPDGLRSASASGCAETTELVAARQRAGWSCTTRQLLRAGGSSTTWECIRR